MAEKTASGRLVLTPLGGGSGASLGALLGGSNGIAGSLAAMRTGTTAISATSVFGPAGFLIGGMAGYIAGEHLDHHQCPSCGERLNI